LTLDPRQPVLVGVGQVTHREGDAPEPVDLLTEAVRRAATDCSARARGHRGGGILDAVGSVRVVNIVSRRYPDPGRLVAERLGMEPPHTVYTTMGGQAPHQLVDRACDDIAAGRFDAVVIGGAESWRTRSRIKRRGEASPWSTQAPDVQPSELFGAPLEMSSADESRLGFTDPLQAYPMFEQALRARHGRSLEQQITSASELWARCSQIARDNEFAAIRTPRSAESIRTPGPDNRMVAFPYTKLMSSNSSVDQAAALIMCSAERADALGVPRDRWVFLHGAGEGEDVHFLTERHDLASSPAIAAAGRAALDLAGVGTDDLAHIDLYSCFPSAVEVAAEALGLPLAGRDLSVTGGLTFAGGPWNEYVVHSLATMAGVLRRDPDAYGLVSANGGFLTKHVVGVWSCRPPVGGSRWRSVQAELDAQVPRRTGAPHHLGTARLETYSVLHDRDGAPERAWAFALTDDGSRTLGVTDSHDLLTTLEREDVLGRRVALRDGALEGFA
jgi:acetyl-CoA C-acetyltransferase